MDRLRCTEIVAAPINTLLEAFERPRRAPRLRDRGGLSEIPQAAESARFAAALLRDTPAQIGTAPDLSAHNDEILAALGYTPAQIEVFGKDRSFNAGEQADPKQARVASANTRGAGWCL